MPQACPPTLGVVLAGGLGRRMGGMDKSLLLLNGRPLLSHGLDRLAPQCDRLVINANGDPSRFAAFGLPVLPDPMPEHLGPLAGILAALEWAASHRPEIEWVLSAPADTPFLPVDLVARLHEARAASRARWACAASGSRMHYAVALWPVDLKDDLRHALMAGTRSIREWAEGYDMGCARWETEPFDPFFNINTPDDLFAASAMVGRYFDAHATTAPR